MIPLSQKGALHMLRVPRSLHHLVQLTCALLTLLVDAAHFLWLCLHSPTALAAENLFLRKQLCFPVPLEKFLTVSQSACFHDAALSHLFIPLTS
jgi:hypothetical protein